MLGLFQTVWHDDGETLYEATWYPVIYAAAAAWQAGDLTPDEFANDFPSAFFGADDASYGDDVGDLATALGSSNRRLLVRADRRALLGRSVRCRGRDVRFAGSDLRAVRLSAESVEQNLYFKRPPLHANAAFVMFLAARRYDALARKFQIASEVRAMYADALAHAASDPEQTERDLLWCRYWMWELRDAYEDLAPLYARAWRYESRDGHLREQPRAVSPCRAEGDRAGRRVLPRRCKRMLQTKTLPPFDRSCRP